MGEGAEKDWLDPLPQRYFTAGGGIGGAIKVRPADFVVEELPLYNPCGEGEHLYLVVRKEGVSHNELVSVLRRHFGVPGRAIGFAGMKDKHAVTHQMVSIHLPGSAIDPNQPIVLDHDRIAVLGAARHRNKLRRGHLTGNRFSIRIRDVDPMAAPAVQRTLRRLEQMGVPCYFGDQRFGYRHNNHLLGAMLLRGDWDDAMAELLGAQGTAFPEHQRVQREHYDAGRYEEAAPMWAAADRAEGLALKRYSATRSARSAIEAIGRTTLDFWANACMSAVFNRLLDARIDADAVDRLVDGDLAWKHDSRAVFAVTAAECASGELEPRLAAFEISPSGPLWGRRMTRAASAVGVAEEATLHAMGVSETHLESSKYAPDGARRPFRVPISNVVVEGGLDEHGGFVRVAFDLPRGMYATVVLREIMKTEGGAGSIDEGHARSVPSS